MVSMSALVKRCEEIADVEDERRRYEQTHKNGDKQRQTVGTALVPERAELLRMVLLHNHSTQEGRNEDHGEKSADAVGPPVHTKGHEAAYERKEDGEHKRDGGNRQYGIDHGDACHLRNEAVPVALGSR